MLDWLKKTEMAARLEAAVARVSAEGKARTYDMSAIGRTRRGEGDKDSTLDVAKAVRFRQFIASIRKADRC
jgi:isocitrate/isopropylmalate dehydrogenase